MPITNPDYTPLVQDREPLSEVRYSGKDFQSLFDAILRRLKIEYKTVYNDYATSSLGIMLIDLMAYATSQLTWYLDRVSSDCFLDTARTRSAVARLVKQIGYKMAPATAASTTEEIVFPSGALVPFTIPAGFRFLGPSGLYFESYADCLVNPAPAPGDSVSVDIRQGETRTLVYTSSGNPNQSYRMANIVSTRFLAEGSVRVWVDGSAWTEVQFLEYEKTDQFEVGYNDDPPTIQFGDGVAGNIPPAASEIKIRFTIIDGLKGNVKANTIMSAADSVLAGGSSVEMSVSNPTGSSGGTDPESTDRAKALAPFAFAARNAAITLNDYIALSNSYSDPMYGRVAVAYAFNPRTSYEDALFNAMVDAIEVLVTDYQATVSAIESSVSSGAASLTDALSSISTDNVILSTIVSNMIGYLQSAQIQMEGARTSNSLYGGVVDDVLAMIEQLVYATSGTDPNFDALENQINATTMLPASKALLLGMATALSDYTASMTALLNQLNSKKSTTENAIDAALSFIYEARSATEDANPPAPLVTLASIQADTAVTLAMMSDTLNDPTDGLVVTANSINGLAFALRNGVFDVLSLMHDRIGELFDADCLSNYVQVPILAYDSEGYYVAPSAGLMYGLQTYLNSVKEVTQDVEVIDGSFNLIPAEIVVQVKVSTEFVPSEVTAQISATIAGILRGRSFNQPLYLDWLYKNVKDISGIEHVNIRIAGPVAHLDSNGNLVPPPTTIISFGTLNIGAV